MRFFDPGVIAALSVPVLCIDTCSLLDIMRDPTRESSQARDRQAAIDLAQRLESEDLVCLIAEQVGIEFSGHDAEVQADAANAIRRLRESVDRVSQIYATFLDPVSVDLGHLDAMVGSARQVVGRWTDNAHSVPSSASILNLAMDRMNRNIAPARKGKDSAKDCIVLETCLGAVGALRTKGLPTKAVFLSSNTKEYLTEGRVLQPDLVTDFEVLNMSYAPNMSAAKSFLGF